MALQQSGQIDFNDMINIATEQVHQGKADYKYRYIIIDEYQDISVSRFNLIKEIKQRTNAKLMCVGDDWQSIFSFQGADPQMFIDIAQTGKIVKLEESYRLPKSVARLAERIVQTIDNKSSH